MRSKKSTCVRFCRRSERAKAGHLGKEKRDSFAGALFGVPYEQLTRAQKHKLDEDM